MTATPAPRRPFWCSIAAFVALAAASSAMAATHVKDDAGLFSSAAAQQAEQQLADVQQRGGKNVIVETMTEPPTSVRDQIIADPSQRGPAILKLAETRAASAGADVYVLINKTPGNLQIAERKTMQSAGLPAATRSQVVDAMQSAFKQKQFDEGLTAGVSLLSQSIVGAGSGPPARPTATPASVPPSPQGRSTDDRTPPPPPSMPLPGGGSTASRGFGGLGCCTIAGIGLLVIIVFAVVRRMGRRGPGQANYGGGGAPPVGGYPQGGAYPQQGAYPPQAGGGFGRGVAGGLLGGVLGSVLGNQWSHGRDNTGQSGGGVFGGNAGTPQDTGYTGSGADFGSSNDAGGGSDPTNDYTGGGADFGGGGDPGGGGGGDSGGSSGGDF